MTNIKKIISNILYFLLIAIVCFFGIQVVGTLIITPILSIYGAAYNFYSVTGNAEYFLLASKFTKLWIINLVILSLSILFLKLVKKKREENE